MTERAAQPTLSLFPHMSARFSASNCAACDCSAETISAAADVRASVRLEVRIALELSHWCQSPSSYLFSSSSSSSLSFSLSLSLSLCVLSLSLDATHPEVALSDRAPPCPASPSLPLPHSTRV